MIKKNQILKSEEMWAKKYEKILCAQACEI